MQFIFQSKYQYNFPKVVPLKLINISTFAIFKDSIKFYAYLGDLSQIAKVLEIAADIVSTSLVVHLVDDELMIGSLKG